MYGVPPAGARWPAVGAPLERGVRPHAKGRAQEVSCALNALNAAAAPVRDLYRECANTKHEDC
jgi:hypothetical protein